MTVDKLQWSFKQTPPANGMLQQWYLIYLKCIMVVFQLVPSSCSMAWDRQKYPFGLGFSIHNFILLVFKISRWSRYKLPLKLMVGHQKHLWKSYWADKILFLLHSSDCIRTYCNFFNFFKYSFIQKSSLPSPRFLSNFCFLFDLSF